MNFKIYSIALFCLIVSCKNKVKSEPTVQQSDNKEMNSAEITKENEADSITVFHVNFRPEETKVPATNLSEINKNLQDEFVNYPFSIDSNQLDETKKIYQSKAFLKGLADDFNNTNFINLNSIQYSFVVPKNKPNVHYISIEEWVFPSKKNADSAFESLKNYRETEIHFKTINWIWVHQDQKLYLIFATDFVVTDPAMQTIKQEIINQISNSGAYDSLQFYE